MFVYFCEGCLARASFEQVLLGVTVKSFNSGVNAARALPLKSLRDREQVTSSLRASVYSLVKWSTNLTGRVQIKCFSREGLRIVPTT